MKNRPSSDDDVYEYDVYLSFRGDDTGSIISHLYSVLKQKIINVYIDDNSLKRGKDNSRAIENSKIAVVVFSESYPRSHLCLDELVHIRKRNETRGMVVLPVFYRIKSSTVRKQRGSYEAVFAEHGKLYGKDKVKEWRSALTAVANLSGWESAKYGSDSKLVDAIVAEIGKKWMGFSKHSASKADGGLFQQQKNKDILGPDNDTHNNFTSHLKHDVFLSFNSSNKDTHNNFTSHLYASLKNFGITTYNYNGTERGDEILPEVVDAIRHSKLYVVVFSKYYTFSSWCRCELEYIVRYSEQCGRLVVPIFYDVDRSSVVKTLEHYQFISEKGKGLMDNLDMKHGSEVGLPDESFLRAWESSSIKPESKLIEGIVGDVLQILKRVAPSSDFNGLVGIAERIDQVKSILLNNSPASRIVGIVGMAGIGKTTLAKVLFDQLSIKFEASCFLGNIRELWASGRKKYLQNKIVSGLSGGEGMKLDKDDLKHKRVLIILDGVEEIEQLELLVGVRFRYGFGSRIIITSRNNKAFETADELYEMKELSFSDALLLFQLNAFKANSFKKDFIELSDEMVTNFRKRNPLSLKVLGSTLCGKSRETWIETLERLLNVTDVDIQQVLRISYDQLNKKEQDVFLDVACFFKGEDEALTKRILDGCWSLASKAIEGLLEMSLITIHDSKLWMHDTLEDLGKKIVQEISNKEPGNRSRLWDSEDVYHVLKNNTGTSMVEAIFLDMCKIKKVEMSPKAFSRMYNLRLLKFHSHFANCIFQFPKGDLEFLPYGLSYLYWDAYPFESLPIDFTGKYLVELQIQFSNIKQLWEKVQRLENLKVMDLSFSKKLIEIPNLSRAPNIESVSLRGCGSLKEVPSYFQDLQKLVFLNLEDCSSLENVLALPENIIQVNLARCSRLKSLPSYTSKLKYLRRLELSGCSGLDFTDLNIFGSSKG